MDNTYYRRNTGAVERHHSDAYRTLLRQSIEFGNMLMQANGLRHSTRQDRLREEPGIDIIIKTLKKCYHATDNDISTLMDNADNYLTAKIAILIPTENPYELRTSMILEKNYLYFFAKAMHDIQEQFEKYKLLGHPLDEFHADIPKRTTSEFIKFLKERQPRE